MLRQWHNTSRPLCCNPGPHMTYSNFGNAQASNNEDQMELRCGRTVARGKIRVEDGINVKTGACQLCRIQMRNRVGSWGILVEKQFMGQRFLRVNCFFYIERLELWLRQIVTILTQCRQRRTCGQCHDPHLQRS